MYKAGDSRPAKVEGDLVGRLLWMDDQRDETMVVWSIGNMSHNFVGYPAS